VSSLEEVPKPQLLDPDRILGDEREEMTLEDHRDRARELNAALHDSCAYADQLWERLDGVRRYLVDSLPEPRLNPHAVGGASPTGPDDEHGWQAWADAYAGITAVLAGPHGDSGFAEDEARQIARARLEFAGGSEPSMETIEGADPVPAPEPAPVLPIAVSQAGSFVVGLVVGWVQGRASAARRLRRASTD
jgi:hypothetical protein